MLISHAGLGVTRNKNADLKMLIVGLTADCKNRI